jgi:hypothetical protein
MSTTEEKREAGQRRRKALADLMKRGLSYRAALASHANRDNEKNAMERRSAR